MITGIDISHYNTVSNFSQLKASGVQFVYIKATEGKTYQDPMCQTNAINALNAGLAVGFYHFARPDNGNSATDEAQNFLNAISSINYNLIPVLDLEVTVSSMDDNALYQWARTFVNTVKSNTGHNVMFYTDLNYLNTHSTLMQLKDLPLWIAAYRTDAPVITGWDWTMWQHTDSATYAGITGNIDENYLKDMSVISLIPPTQTSDKGGTGMLISESRFPVLIELRDTYVDIEEPLVIWNNQAYLTELPDPFNKVFITGYTEIDKDQTLTSGKYSVDYDSGIVTFGGTIANGTTVTAQYKGRGNLLYPAKRMYVYDKNTGTYTDLQNLFEANANNNVISVNGKYGVINLTAADVGALSATGGTLNGRLLINNASVDPKISGKNSSDPITSYPLGISVQALNGETGFPSNSGTLTTVYESDSRNYQLFHAKDTNYLYIRTWNDSTNSWTTWNRLLYQGDFGSGSGIDADMVDGKHASYFEDMINNHISNTNNPHNVTAVQVPISDSGNYFTTKNVEAALQQEAQARLAHVNNTNNPHNVTAVQVPISDSGNYFTSTTVEGALQEEAQARIAHANRTDNPHNVTASQVPIADTANHFVATTVEDALTELYNKFVARSHDFYDVKDFGAVGDGVTDDTQAIQTAIDTCNANGGGIVFLPAGTYKVTSTITLREKVFVRGAGMNATYITQPINQSQPTFATPVPTIKSLTQTNDISVGDLSNNISNTASAGDFVVYKSNRRFTEEWDGGTAIRSYYTKGEIFRVKSATSTSITFTEPANLDLPVANTTGVDLFTPTNFVGVSDMTIDRTVDTTSQSASVHLRYCNNAIVQNVRSLNTNWAGIAVDRSMNAFIQNIEVYGGTYDLGLNYGVLVTDGSKNVYVSDLRARNCRHGFSGGGSGYAIPMRVVVNGLFVTETQQPPDFPNNEEHSIDTHGCTMNFIIKHCQVDYGMSISGIGHQVSNVISTSGKFEQYEGGTDMTFRGIRYLKCTSIYANYNVFRTKFINIDIYLYNWRKNVLKNGSKELYYDNFKIVNGNFRVNATSNSTADATVPDPAYRIGVVMRPNSTFKNGYIEGFPQAMTIEGKECSVRDVRIVDCGWDSTLTSTKSAILLTKDATGSIIDNVIFVNTKTGLTRNDPNNCYIRLYASGTGAGKYIAIMNTKTSTDTPSSLYPYKSKIADSGFSEIFYMNNRLSNSGGGNVHNETNSKFVFNSFRADN